MSKKLWGVTGIMLIASIAVGAASAQQMATLIINVRTGEEPGNALIRVLGPHGESVGRGRSGEAINVPPGCYTIVVKNLDLLDQPERRRRDVWLKAAPPTRHTSRWPVAKVKLVTQVGGRAIKTKVVLSHGGGGDPICEFSSGEFIKISPGHYQAKVYRGSNPTTVTGLHFRSGGEQVMPVKIR